jgi:serine/threonine-protein kinase
MLELAPGTALGAYVITARIGRGGMASVYQAHHPALDRDVAIKVLWPSLADQAGFLERFRREARSASRLRHRNILTVYDFGESNGIAYMVT